MITDSTSTWDEVLGTTSNYNLAKSYVYLRVRILFDPPNTSFVLTALSDQLRELEWRLSVEREATGWVNPNLDVDLEEETVLDGGAV
jgi:hypothetical protein